MQKFYSPLLDIFFNLKRIHDRLHAGRHFLTTKRQQNDPET